MQTSAFKLSVSCLFLAGLSGFGCGQTTEASSAGSPQGEAGEGSVAWHSVNKAPQKAARPAASSAGSVGTAATEPDPTAGAAGETAGGAPGATTDGAPTPAVSDHVPPHILSVTPQNGAVGVTADTAIVISFSEAMDQRATLDAFASETLPRDHTSLTWNEAGTSLTIQPDAPLEYAQTTLQPGEALELDAKQYGYALTRLATDLAGNPLQETSVTFSTLREVTQTYGALPELTGVLPGASNDPHFYGLVTFDAEQLPAGIVTVEHAVTHADPYVLGADVPIYHVRFNQLAPSALAAPGPLIETLPRGTTGDQVIPEKLITLLAPDYAGRSPAYHYSQYRLQLPPGLGEADVLAVSKFLVDVKIEAQYLLP